MARHVPALCHGIEQGGSECVLVFRESEGPPAGAEGKVIA